MAINGVTRDRVIDTAVAIVEREGVEALTLTAIAKELSISQPAVYRHVENHREVLRAVSLRGREALADTLAEAGIGRAGDDAIRAMGRAWRAFVHAHPRLYMAIDATPAAGDPDLERAIERVVAVLMAGLAAHDLPRRLRVDAARALRSSLHGFTDIEARQGHPLPHDLDSAFEHLLDILCAGVEEMTQRSRAGAAPGAQIAESQDAGAAASFAEGEGALQHGTDRKAGREQLSRTSVSDATQ